MPNFGLTNQDSKILEIAITQEKSELLNYFLRMDTNQEELQIEVVFSRLSKDMLKLL